MFFSAILQFARLMKFRIHTLQMEQWIYFCAYSGPGQKEVVVVLYHIAIAGFPTAEKREQ